MYSKFLELEPGKQKRIINAALKEFAQNGYEKASTNEIVKQAEISKGLLFHYFGSKKGLFLFLYDYTSKVFIEEFLEPINLEERNILARWRQYSLLKFDLIHKYPEMFNFIIVANQIQPDEIQEEMQNRNRDILTLGYEKLFGNIDKSKFRDDIDVEKVLHIIKWTMDGFANVEQQKMKMSDPSGMDFDGMLAELHKRLAYVPSDVSLWPNLTDGEVIDLLAKLRGNLDTKRRKELIERFDFDPSKKCRTYSKGNRQKVAIISAFVSDVSLLVLDEPTTGLDPLIEMVFQECVLDAKKDGKTVFLSSHILAEVEKLCDRVSIIKEGTIVEAGTLAEFRHFTRTVITADTEKQVGGLAQLSGVYNVQTEGKRVTFSADSD